MEGGREAKDIRATEWDKIGGGPAAKAKARTQIQEDNSSFSRYKG